MHRFVHVGFTFPGVPKMRDLELAFTVIGDWIRYSALSWIVWTDMPTGQIFARLRPYIDSSDNVLIAPLDLTDTAGVQPPWVWEWMNSKRKMIAVAPSHSPYSLGSLLSPTPNNPPPMTLGDLLNPKK
jgi:hypothetical protein